MCNANRRSAGGFIGAGRPRKSPHRPNGTLLACYSMLVKTDGHDAMPEYLVPKIVTTVLTGFLGSGKTTLLNHILTTAVAERIAVIVNEFGEVGIDGQLIVDVQEDILELNNGCICCTVRSPKLGISTGRTSA
jgi:CobW/HypB/UreG family nucleotide-binding protein